MAKVAIVYWSGTGNTEAMANLVAKGVTEAGGEPSVIQVSDFSADRLDEFDAFALGCPAMGDEELEDGEFLPVYDEIEPLLPGRKVVFFGSYDWNDGEWMDNWAYRASNAGVDAIETVIAKDYPSGDEADACVELGKTIATA